MDKRRVLRIIDVNTNRANEGLRVVEEIVRFVLEDEKLTIRLKSFRSQIKQNTTKLLDLQSRRVLDDVGRGLYPESEGKRSNLMEVFKSNIKRAQEALRCLEEFSKLISPSSGKKFKAIRFELYELEKQIEPRLSRVLKMDFDLYLVTDPMRDHVKTVKEAIKGGIQIVQLRDKFASRKKYLALAQKIRKITKKAGVTFIINDYVNIAKKVDADGVHLGQTDVSPERARKILGPDKIIGVSTHSLGEALKAEAKAKVIDYIAVGNVFETPSKPGKKGIGIRGLAGISKEIKLPIVAIGGINRSNIQQITDAGVSRVAVIRAVVAAKNIAKAIMELLRK